MIGFAAPTDSKGLDLTINRPPARTALAAAAAALTLSAGVASAATPKPGDYFWNDERNETIVASVSFQVDDNSNSIDGFFGQSFGCEGGAPASVTKSIQVKSSGKFSFSGKGRNPVGDKVAVTIKGKFVKPKKATGSFAIGDCEELKFKARYTKGG